MAANIAPHDHWYDNVPQSSRNHTVFGYLVVVIAVFGFGLWAGTAQIEGAIVSHGNFVVAGQNKMIQHLEGGIIKKILVSEGQIVKREQTLLQLDDTVYKVKLRRLVMRHAKNVATLSRLRAEARFRKKLSFPKTLLKAARTDKDIKRFVKSQRLLFQSHHDKIMSEINILKRTKQAHKEREIGAQKQIDATRLQIRLIREELRGKKKLYRKGLIRKSEILAIQRAEARYRGEVGRLLAVIGDARQRIAKSNREISREKYVAIQKAVEDLQNVEAQLQDLREQITEARQALTRIEIKSPVQGVVVKMNYHTSGGVIEAGKNILELLPLGTELVIEAQVRPQDIDLMKKGMPAVVRLTALNQRITPMIPGEVIYISADKLPADKRRMLDDVYIARIKLDPMRLRTLKNFKPTPGMPAEVYIKTSKRTFFNYLVEPLIDSMSHAFRES